MNDTKQKTDWRKLALELIDEIAAEIRHHLAPPNESVFEHMGEYALDNESAGLHPSLQEALTENIYGHSEYLSRDSASAIAQRALSMLSPDEFNKAHRAYSEAIEEVS